MMKFYVRKLLLFNKTGENVFYEYTMVFSIYSENTHKKLIIFKDRKVDLFFIHENIAADLIIK